MPKRTDNALLLPSPHCGRGCLNRQIEAGEGTLPVRQKSVAAHHQYWTQLHGSRNGSLENLGFQENLFDLCQFPRSVAYRQLRRSNALLRTGNRRCSDQSRPVVEILRRSVGGCAAFARAVSQHRSSSYVTRASDLSVRAFSPYPLTRSLRDHPLPRRGEGQVLRLTR